MAIYKAYKDECLIIGILTEEMRGENYDGYVDISPAEKKKIEKVEQEFWEWQELLGKRYKKA
jgi:hypothetical protein